MHVINLDYLEDRPSHFTKLPNSGTKELNNILERLNNVVIISDNNNKHPQNLLDSKAKWIKKKEEKT